MAQDKKDESFRVVDRRLFTPEGELRKEVVEEERERREHHAEKTIGGSAQGAKPGGVTTAVETQTDKAPAQPAAPETPDDGVAAAASRSFEMLVDFLARNAAALLGGMSDPRTGQAYVDLEGAREMIDMLDALHEKTRGNLAPEDERLLLEVVGSLKLSYMEVSKVAAQAMLTKAKGKP